MLFSNFLRQVPRQHEQNIRLDLAYYVRLNNRNMATRHKFPLLGERGIAHHRQQIRLDTGVVEKGVALGGGAVGKDALSFPLLPKQEIEQPVFDRIGTGLEVIIGRKPRSASALSNLLTESAVVRGSSS